MPLWLQTTLCMKAECAVNHIMHESWMCSESHYAWKLNVQWITMYESWMCSESHYVWKLNVQWITLCMKAECAVNHIMHESWMCTFLEKLFPKELVQWSMVGSNQHNLQTASSAIIPQQNRTSTCTSHPTEFPCIKQNEHKCWQYHDNFSHECDNNLFIPAKSDWISEHFHNEITPFIVKVCTTTGCHLKGYRPL